MNRAFVDTSAFFADLVANDAHHQDAKQLFDQAAKENWQLVTSNAVVSETYTLLRKRARNGFEVATGFLDDMGSGVFRIERISEDDERSAEALLRSHADKAYSFCDALSFVAIERLDIQQAIAFDRDFRSYGIAIL